MRIDDEVIHKAFKEFRFKEHPFTEEEWAWYLNFHPAGLDTFTAGFKASQSLLIDKNMDSFEEFFSGYASGGSIHDHMLNAWQAANLASEKDKKILYASNVELNRNNSELREKWRLQFCEIVKLRESLEFVIKNSFTDIPEKFESIIKYFHIGQKLKENNDEPYI